MAEGWFCVMSEPRRERVAEESLREAGCEPYLPRYTREAIRNRRKVTLTEPLFPGYLFVAVDRARHSLYELRRAAEGVARFVTMGGVALEVPSDAITAIRTAETLCQLSDSVQPLFSPGEPVRVSTMPYQIARIVKAGPRDRWLIAMQWFGVEREAWAEACNLEPA
jgi:transcriptional antiterminator RfaH